MMAVWVCFSRAKKEQRAASRTGVSPAAQLCKIYHKTDVPNGVPDPSYSGVREGLAGV